jgi:hypothetical protein
MNWIIGLLIVVLGLTLLISGVTGTAGQVYRAVTGRGDGTADPNAGGFGQVPGLNDQQLNGIFGYPHGGVTGGAGG